MDLLRQWWTRQLAALRRYLLRMLRETKRQLKYVASETRRLFGPRIRTDIPFEHSGRCKLLRNHQEVDDSIAFLRAAGYDLHPCEPKNWDLAHILSEVDLSGNFLDMGSWESQVLLNLA